MHFCDKCGNMYYIVISEDDPNTLQYNCNKCGDKNTTISISGISVSKLDIKGGEQKYNHIINKNTKKDPTLPRSKKIPCPNDLCETNTKASEREVISIRYDTQNMKYIHLCSTCDTIFKIN
jgi:DNA-directed RNA polymerase subunit M/transcription elongation factor TFIIS